MRSSSVALSAPVGACLHATVATEVAPTKTGPRCAVGFATANPLGWLIALTLLLFALSPAARAQDDIIHPRGTAPAGSPASSPAGGLNSLFLLGAAAVAGGTGWWLWQKRRTAATHATGARLAIVESRPLGSRQYLVVADYDGKKFLLGVCPGSIEMLTPLDGQPPPK